MQELPDGTLLLPLSGTFDHYFLYGDSRRLRLQSHAEAMIAELTVTMYQERSTPGRKTVPAYDLCSSAVHRDG